jgi:hypothetical protein
MQFRDHKFNREIVFISVAKVEWSTILEYTSEITISSIPPVLAVGWPLIAFLRKLIIIVSWPSGARNMNRRSECFDFTGGAGRWTGTFSFIYLRLLLYY